MTGFEYSGIRLEQIDSSSHTLDFDCGDQDLNDFFRKDSEIYRRELLTASYMALRIDCSAPTFPFAFVDFCADAVRREELGGARRKIHYLKRGFRSFPAIKITRFGIQKELQGSGLGSLVLDVVKHFLVERQQIGARFLTLDAYPSRVGFYQKNHFRELQAKDDRTASETVPMFFDLKELLKPIPESGTLLR